VKLLLQRTEVIPDAPGKLGGTRGDLLIDGEPFCFTLEDPVRQGPKIWGRTAIPAGVYRVTVAPTNPAGAFRGRRLPHVHDVPGFSDILIHGGNRVEETRGCPLLGLAWHRTDRLFILKSADAVSALLGRMMPAEIRGEEFTLEVRNP
jgi:hypothetical protein